MGQGEIILEVQDLHVYYDKVKALKGVSIKVIQGEVVTIIGANGAGKSTLLRTVSGLLPIDKGKVNFLGRDTSRTKSHRLVQQGLIHVPEGRAILNRMTVYENLIMGAYYQKQQREIENDVQMAYELFPILAERKNQMAGTLSGGQPQILAIARGLLVRPKLMMLDEPSLGLAPLIIKNIFSTVAGLRERGITVLLIEQNAKQALKIADRAYVFETGKVTCADTAANLLHSDTVIKAYLGENTAGVRNAG